jgi:hypothetical protein
MIAKRLVGSAAAYLLILVTGLPCVWARSNDTLGTEGPSLEETLAFIKDTWEACETMRSGSQRGVAKDGSLWYLERMAKVDVVVRLPSALNIVTRLNERRKLSGAFELQTPTESIQEFDLSAMSPNVSTEREGDTSNLYGIRLSCARPACVTERVASLMIPGKPLHDLKTGRVVVTSLEELVYEDRAPQDIPGSKKGEAYIPACDRVAAESLSKALNHAIIKVGGKKSLF